MREGAEFLMTGSGNQYRRARIIYEDEAILAVYKPAGLAVESRNPRWPDLVRQVRNMQAAARQNGQCGNGVESRETFMPEPVHRLDQPVEGIVLLAKTRDAARSLTEQIRQHRVEKAYLAVVHTDPDARALLQKKPEAELKDFLCREEGNRSRVAGPKEKGARLARLSYVCLQQGTDNCALLKIRLYTGRHHQIRVQLANAGMPIAGDHKYGKCAAVSSEESRNDMPALCAFSLTFFHPVTKKRMHLSVRPENPQFMPFLSGNPELL